jgi:predicted transcriptional regulator of viral defense system
MVALGPDGVILGSPQALKSDAIEKTRDYGGKTQTDPVIDRAIAALAERQHGVVAIWQLLALGLGTDAIQYRVSIGRLHRIHRGVYAVGYRKLTRQGHRMAAVLAYGPDAVLSHRSAAAHWDLSSGSYRIDVTTPTERRSRKGLRVHTATLHEEDRTTHDGIPITTVARTIFDLAAQTHQDGLTYLIEAADRKDRLDLQALDRAIARRPRAPGTKRLNAVLATYRGPADTRSHLERGFRKLIAKAGLPEPQFNVVVAGLTVDVYWPQWRLVVELDSGLYHDTPRGFETDRIRDAILQKARVRVLRVTDERFDHDANGVLADIIALARA